MDRGARGGAQSWDELNASSGLLCFVSLISFFPISFVCLCHGLSDELIHKILAEPHRGVVPAAELDFGVDVVVAAGIAGSVVVDQSAADVEQRDHLVHVII